MRISKIFFIFHLFFLSLFADVNLYIKDEAIKGENFVFTIEITAQKIKIPKFPIIAGYTVYEVSNSVSTKIINGNISKTVKRTYSLIPDKNFTFPSLEFEIDGKKYITKEKSIKVNSPSKTKSDLYDLMIKTNKSDFYVGENFILTLVFKHKKDLQVVGLSLNKPNFENFWYKQIDETKKYEEKGFNVIELKFLLTPLLAGNIKINPILLQAQILDDSYKSFFSSTKDISIYSNELNFNIKELPQNIKLVGNFDIESSINKKKIKKGEAISYKLNIKGSGNIDDLPDFKLPLDNLTIYENKPEIKTYISNDNYEGIYEKVFSIVPDKSFIIPSITLEYFDKDKQKVITKTTKSYEIEVESEDKEKEVVLEKAKETESSTKEVLKIVEKSSLKDRVISFILGVIFTVLVFSIYLYITRYKNIKKEKLTPLSKKVKETKTKIELIKILAIYMKIDSKLDTLIFELEKTEDFINVKKEILKVLKELKL